MDKTFGLINDEHYKALINIIKTFERYKVGKGDLISYRNRLVGIDNIGNNEQDFINLNEQVKNEYISLVDRLAREFKWTLREPN